jgi:hypothetical protein
VHLEIGIMIVSQIKVEQGVMAKNQCDGKRSDESHLRHYAIFECNEESSLMQ